MPLRVMTSDIEWASDADQTNYNGLIVSSCAHPTCVFAAYGHPLVMGHKVVLVQLERVVSVVRHDAHRRLILTAPIFQVSSNSETRSNNILI
jgi:hypothetical protein